VKLQLDAPVSTTQRALIAAGLLLGPLAVYTSFGMSSWRGMQQTEPSPYTVPDLVYGTVLYGVVYNLWLVTVLRLFCGWWPWRLNLRPGTILRDLLAGALLMIACALIVGTFYNVLMTLVPYVETQAMADIWNAAYTNRTMLLLIVGPYSWLCAAVLEEFNRAFMLSQLLRIAPGPTGPVAGALLTSLLFGLTHLYQGIPAAVTQSLWGLLMALFYLKWGRLLPLILAHGLYDMYAFYAGYAWWKECGGGTGV
jgi:membrane protease YdiL (CAAX protease family)